MKNLLIIQRDLPNALQGVSFDFEDSKDKFVSVKIDVIDGQAIGYENFDEHISIETAGIFKEIQERDFDAIVIPTTYGPSPLSYDGFQLAMHIRLSNNELGKRCLVPIVLMGFEQVNQLAQLGCPYLSFLSTPQIYYAEESVEGLTLFIKENGSNIRSITEEELIVSLPQYPIYPQPHLESNHSLANEWGAFELDQVTVKKLSKRENWINNSLYIKYLKIKSGYIAGRDISLKLSEILQINTSRYKPKVLYIDDEHQKGWEKTLKAIFDEADIEFDCATDIKKGKSRAEVITSAKDKIRSCDWDLILLDIRLTEDDSQENDANNFSGFEILKFIKLYNPVLPVIIFTASTKAKTIDIFSENGADGFYIKHSPDATRTPQVVSDDVERFFERTKTCLDKSVLLKPYWKYIGLIDDSNLIREKGEGTPDETDFRGRIYERLCMFVGLLKKAYEQTKFDKEHFHYDNYETAFLTLWSCLNEISESYFTKTQPTIPYLLNERDERVKDKNEKEITKNPNGKPLTYRNTNTVKHYKWEVNGKAFLHYKYWAKSDSSGSPETGDKRYWYQTYYEQRSSFKLDLDTDSYIYQTDKKTERDYQKEIRLQIVFILINKFNTGINKSDPIINLFENVRDVRNHLYLTHASDDLSDYTKTLRKTGFKVMPDDTRDLFKLIYFLLKGELPSI